MNDYKRRDLLNYLNNDHFEIQKQQYDEDSYSKNLDNSFFEYLINSNLLNKSHAQIDSEIVQKCSDIFKSNKEQILVRSNIYDAIDLVFKANLELYENVLVSDMADSYYERCVNVNRGRFSRVYVDFNDSNSAMSLMNTSRLKNAKILVISTSSSVGRVQVFETIKSVIENTHALVIIDDTNNELDSLDFIWFLENYNNVIVIKSSLKLRKMINDNTAFIISNREIIEDLTSLTNYSDINMLNKSYILFSLVSYNMSDLSTTSDIISSIENQKNELSQKEIVETANTVEVNETYENKDFDEVNEDSELNKKSEKLDYLDNNKTSREKVVKKKEVRELDEDDYEPNLIFESKQSLIAEIGRFDFVSIFSSNAHHVYIVVKKPIHGTLLDNGIILKRYNSSNGEIIRLNIENTNQNIKVLKIINRISKTIKPIDLYEV